MYKVIRSQKVYSNCQIQSFEFYFISVLDSDSGARSFLMRFVELVF